MDIIKMAREMGAAIQQEPEYLALCAAKQANDEDEALQKMIEDFNKLMHEGEMKAAEMAAEMNEDESALDEIGAQIQDGYDAIMNNVNMVRYNQCKDKIDAMMQKVVAILAASVNGEDPMTFDPDTEEEHHCGGDCGHCHGCD